MQNRYIADVGDYGKYGLLRYMSKTNLRLGVNWYLTPDESHNADGKHIGYLENHYYREYDAELFDVLKDVLLRNRHVHEIQTAAILPNNTVFYEKVLNLEGINECDVRQRTRLSWHESALQKLQECDIVFLDPDNGLQIKSTSLTSKKGNKYIGIEELMDYCKLGKSIIFYNHRERKQEQLYLVKFRALSKAPIFNGYTWLGLKFAKGTIRDYIFVIHPNNLTAMWIQYHDFLKTKWCEMFSPLDIKS